MPDAHNTASTTELWEMVQRALSFGPEGYPPDGKPVYIWSDADKALASLRAKVEERDQATERADHWQHQFHVMGETANRAERELAEARTALRNLLADYERQVPNHWHTANMVRAAAIVDRLAALTTEEKR